MLIKNYRDSECHDILSSFLINVLSHSQYICQRLKCNAFPETRGVSIIKSSDHMRTEKIPLNPSSTDNRVVIVIAEDFRI